MSLAPSNVSPKPLRIAMDGHWLICWPQSGIASYLRGLLSGWVQMKASVEVDLYIPHPPRQPIEPLLLDARIRLIQSSREENPITSYRAQLHWQQRTIPQLLRRHQPEVYLSPFHLTPQWPKGVKVVSTIHDVCFLADPLFSAGGLIHRGQVWSTCFRANRVICISQATQNALTAWLPSVRRKAVVVHNGMELKALEVSEARAIVRDLGVDLVPHEYFIWVGVPCDRKNLALVFEVFCAYAKRYPEHQLVVVTLASHAEPVRQLVQKHGVQARFRMFNDIDNRTRDALYRCARALIFPSSCEGFGYPALEAMAQGCPVYALEHTPMQELLGNIVPPVAEATVGAFTAALDASLPATEAAREQLQTALMARAHSFSNQRMASETLKVLESTAKA